MPTPVVQPKCVCLKTAPLESQVTYVTIAQTPSSAQVTASITNASPFVTLKHLVGLESVRRPFTEEEIAELPPFPPSIRKNARNRGTTEIQEIARAEDGGPLTVSAGVMVQVAIEFLAPPQAASPVIVATLVIEGTTWERVEVPMCFLTGSSTSVAGAEPTSIRFAAEPGETLTQDVVIAKVPQAATMLAYIDHGDSIIRIKAVIAYRPVRKLYTEEELSELPPFPPNIREDARRNGYIEYQELGRSDACRPLTVPAGALVKAYLEFTAPEHGAPDVFSTRLVLLATTWQEVEIPLYLIIGKITTTLTLNALTLRQGESGDLPIEVTSIAGPATPVYFDVGEEWDPLHIDPDMVYVDRGATVVKTVKVVAEPIAPVGARQVGLVVRAFERLQSRTYPFHLTVKQGRVVVLPQQVSLVGKQGTTVFCSVRVISQGGSKEMTFLAGSLPDGVHLNAPARRLGPGAESVVIELMLSIDATARPLANQHAVIHWSAGDGEHSGFLDIPFTVILDLQTRSFSQAIVTPTGTALGGRAEITIRNDGNCTFTGHMRATGLPSYKFRVRAVLRSASGRLTIAVQKSGEAYGTDTPGDRQFNWNEPVFSQVMGDQWADFQSGSMIATKSYEMTGVLGSLGDLLADLLDYLVGYVVLGPVSGVIFLGTELGRLTGVQFPGAGGLSGLMLSGGAAFLVGPGFVIPALIAGSILGELVIKNRAMTEEEEAFAAKVFGDTLPTDRIVITNLLGLESSPFTVPSLDGKILLNLGDEAYDHPMTFAKTSQNYIAGQTFIHELTHAWQIAYWPVTVGYFWEFVTDIVNRSEAVMYGPAGPVWSSFRMEQQALIVDHWFAGSNVRALQSVPGRSPMNENDPYFQYIANNIRMAQI